MCSNIFTSKTKQLFINIFTIVLLILFSLEPLFANRDSRPEAKIYNYLKVDLATDNHNHAAVASNQEDDLNAAIKSSLLSYGNDKLTPSPNEEIDLYTGTLKLHYVDFSIPIAPGLNLEVNRVYDSAVYNYVNFDQRTNFWRYDYNLPSWNIGTSYIYERIGALCTLKDDPCDLILVQANGSSEALRRKNIYSQKWESKGGSIYDGDTGILVDRRGFKYTYDGHGFTVNGGLRDYLTKVETPDGKHWLKYQYDGPYLKAITSSDENKKVSINITHPPDFYKHHHKLFGMQEPNFSMLEPTGIVFEGREVVKYDYGFYDGLDKFFGRIALNKVTKANGETVEYKYDYFNLKKQHSSEISSSRLQLMEVIYSNGEKAYYSYVDDDDENANKYLRNIRIDTVNHYTNNKFNNHENINTWRIAQNSHSNYEGIKTRTITVNGPYHSTQTIYSHSSNEYAWQAGLPLEKYIYNDKNISDSNILQKEVFTWDKKLFSNQYYYLSSSIKEAGFDTQTFKPRMTGKKILQYNENGIDTYNIAINDFDDYDNPTEIVITGNNGQSRTIHHIYENNSQKNIIGLVTKTSINGKTILQQNYNNSGQVIFSKKLGKQSEFTYLDGMISSISDANNNTTYYKDYNGVEPTVVKNPDDTVLYKTINSNGTVQSETDANGNKTSYEYDDNKRLIKSIPEIGASTSYTYQDFDKYIHFDDYKVHEEYNHAGLLLSKTENNDRKQVIQYDGLGRKIFESYPHKLTLSDSAQGHYYNYDSLNRLVSDCYPSLSKSCVSYNYLSNNTVKVTAPGGEYKITMYESFSPGSHNPIKIIEDKRTTEIKRDYLDRVIAVTQYDGSNKVTKNYNYDDNHNLVKFTEPETGVTEYEYDRVGNVKKVLLNGKSIEYELHPKNYRIKAKKYSDESYNESFQYDKNGNLLESTKGDITRTYEYDKTNKLIKEGLLLDIDNKSVPSKSYVTYDYNNKGYLSKLTYPDGYVLDLSPNVYGRPTKLGDYINNIYYHPDGKWSNFSFASGVKAGTQQDEYQRTKKYQYGTLSLAYDYDGNNNLRNLNLNDSNSKDFNYNLSFGYDLLGRITSANGPWGNKTYGYDGINNITSINLDNKTKNQNYKFQYSNLKMTSIKSSDGIQYFDYDDFGNITRDSNNYYVYGLDGHLLNTRGASVSHYQYDTNGHRIIKTENHLFGNHETIGFYTKSGDLLMEHDLKHKKSIKYIYFNGHKVVKIEQAQSSKNNKNDKIVEYYYNDAIGSPVAMADSKGNILWHQIYEPYGITYLSKDKKSNNKFLFAGKEKDETGLSYFGARYYSANQARFMSPDPVEVQPDNPNTFNRYVYANNNPYKYVDPDGRFPTNNPYIDFSEASFGAVVGGIAGYAHTGTLKGAMIGAVSGGLTGYLANPLSAWTSGMVAATGGYRAAQATSVFTKLSTYTGGAATGNYLLTGDFNLSSALFGAIGGMLGGKLINPMAVPVESNLHFMLNSSYSYLTGELMSRSADAITSNGTNSHYNSYNSSLNSIKLDNLSGGTMNMGSMCYASKGDVAW